MLTGSIQGPTAATGSKSLRRSANNTPILWDPPKNSSSLVDNHTKTPSNPLQSLLVDNNHTDGGLSLHQLESITSSTADEGGEGKKRQRGDEIEQVGGGAARLPMKGIDTLFPPLQFAELCPQEWQNTSRKYAWSAESANRCCGPKRCFSTGSNNKDDSLNITSRIHEYKYYMGAPLGNMLVHYFNERAVAYLRNETFVANGPYPTGIMSCFPMVVSPSQVGTSQLQAIQSRLKSPIKSYGYPHMFATAPFHVVQRMILSETISIAEAWSSLPPHIHDLPDNNTVVVHLRCDAYILDNHDEYGILPHRFVLDRIPNSTKEVVIVRKPEGGENACTWSYKDLVEQLAAKKPGLVVRVRSGAQDPISDWLYMARAKTLVCSPSTFCLTAAWGNPNMIYFPTCGNKGAVVGPDPYIQQVLNDTGLTYPNFVWVDTDYLPGKFAKEMNKTDVINYARSQFCNTSLHGCFRNPSAILNYSDEGGGKKRHGDGMEVGGGPARPQVMDANALSPPLQFAELCPKEWQKSSSKYKWSTESANRCCGPKRCFSKGGDQDGSLNTTSRIHEYKYYMGAPLGNMLVHYFNERAVAYLRNETFVANGPYPTGIMSCFPMVVSPSQVGTSQLQAIQSRLKSPIKSYGYPHMLATASFHVVQRMILNETISIAEAWSSLLPHQNDLPGNTTVVVHQRCDDYILNMHDEYGILPHRFVLDRIPNGTKEVVIVRKPEGGENACTWSYKDLARQLAANKPGLTVRVRSGAQDPISDWLYMARAKTLLCSPSTFCLTAAWGNPNMIYFPTCGTKGAVVGPDPHIQQVLNDTGLTYPNFVWVDTDYLPGKVAREMNKTDVINYARSQFCNTSLHGCFRNQAT